MKQFFLIFFLLPFFSFSQVEVYKSYDDYINKKGEIYDDYNGYEFPGWGYGVKLKLKKENKTVKINTKTIWGFKYSDVLFRTDNNFTMPAEVVSIGKICYYENGLKKLEEIYEKKTVFWWYDQTYGSLAYVSKDLKSPLVVVEGKHKALGYGQSKASEVFLKEYPEYSALFDCINLTNDFKNFKPCVDSFETKK